MPGKIYQDEVSILDICVPNTKPLPYITETVLEIKSHIEPDKLIVGY